MSSYQAIKLIPTLKFHFDGVLSFDKIQESLTSLKATLSEDTSKKYNVVWDCMEVEDFEISIRDPWQKAIRDAKKQLEVIILVTDSPLLSNYAALMSMVTNMEVQVVNPYEKSLQVLAS